ENSGSERPSLSSPRDHLGECGAAVAAAAGWVPRVPSGVEAHPGQIQLMQRCLRHERELRPGGFYVIVSFLHDLVKSLGGDERQRYALGVETPGSGGLGEAANGKGSRGASSPSSSSSCSSPPGGTEGAGAAGAGAGAATTVAIPDPNSGGAAVGAGSTQP
ncbi:unnamed protein product, partial [Scytosiphon promiscuus]